MTKTEFIANVATKTEIPKKETALIIDTLFEQIKQQIASNDSVNFVGFGAFEPKVNKARIGVNPATSEKIQIKASNTIRFKVGKTLKKELNW